MKKERVWVLFGIVFLVIISLYFDNKIVLGFAMINTPILTQFFSVLTFLSQKFVLMTLVTSLFLWRENKRKWILPLWSSFIISGIVAFILKVTIQRPRPFQLGLVSLMPSLVEEGHSIWNFSFPSSHAFLAFCAIPILAQQFPKLKKWFFGFAVLIGVSRVYFGLHFLSDVIIGAIMGYVIGSLVVAQEKDKKFWERVYDKAKDKIRDWPKKKEAKKEVEKKAEL